MRPVLVIYLLAFVVFPIRVGALPGASSSRTSFSQSSHTATNSSQRGISVALVISSQGGALGKALGAGSNLSTPTKIKEYLAKGICSAGVPNSPVESSLVNVRAAESRNAKIVRCDLVCRRIVNLPDDDPALDPLIAAWVVEALQVAEHDALRGSPDATYSLERPWASAAARRDTLLSAPTIETLGARFFAPQDAAPADVVQQRSSTLKCPEGLPRRVASDALTESQSDYARGLRMWTRVEEALPHGSDLKAFAQDWVRVYRLTSDIADCESWDNLLLESRWPADGFFRSEKLPRPVQSSE